jgi:two-component system sensor histidine kinase/response regulator
MAQAKPCVLLVDDVEANLVALSALLEDMDCELVRAHGGNEALRQMLKREFAVMLLDVQMPGMDGFEVAQHARSHPSTREVPIIFLTATHEGEQGMLRGYGTGAVDFLWKPLNPDVLRAKVRVFLELYLSRRRLADEVAAHKQTLSALQLANEALRHFTNAASHDLKAPLRTLRGFLGALSEDLGDQIDAQARDYLQRSQRASERMDSLLDSLLNYARLQRPIALGDVDCGALVAQVRSDLGERIERSGARVKFDGLPSVRGDADRLYQLFLNLIGNAVKFRRADLAPEVEVSARRQNGDWLFCIADNGIGIDAKHRAAVFEAFRRLHSESNYEGSGLGLAICKQIVEQHGGHIWVESDGGKGARFCFSLSAERATGTRSRPA